MILSYEATAHTLPHGARELLIEHIDGPIFTNVAIVVGKRVGARTALLERKLIRYDNPSNARPTSTVITEAGRYVLAIILARCAETLIRAGYGIEAEAKSALQHDIIVLEEHFRTLQPPSDQSDASPSPARASGPAPTLAPQPQTVASVVD